MNSFFNQFKISRHTGLLLLVLFVGANCSIGQRWKLRRYEVGGGLGLTQTFGDIGGTPEKANWFGLRDIKFSESNIAAGLYAKYKIDPSYSVTVQTTYAQGQGNDLNSRNVRGREYKTRFVEFGVQGEFFLIGEEKNVRSASMYNRRGMLNNFRSFSMYGFLGLNGLYFMPEFSGSPGSLEQSGDNFSGFSKFTFSVPFGVGVRYILDDRWVAGAELGYRWTATDYLDGFTQERFSKFNDVYYILQFKAGYRLRTSRRGIPVFLDRGFKKTRRSKRAI